jgi:predicted nucleotidyltransferase
MRLTKKEVEAIKRNFEKIFDGDIYLFGSRVDSSKRGGDIDLYISSKNRENLISKKIDFLIALKNEIGEQKIDVVFDKNQDRLIDRKAKNEGIRL